ncbi:MAG: DUF92 domain-containing protein [Candidatus Thermoplasmatota archaeon]|nr:DUF92 domain-containing protein [Candidatus Thermoplasmatota archaeon]
MSDVLTSLIPQPEGITLVLGSSLCLLLGIFSYFRKVLDLKASILASALGFMIIIYSDFFWFFLLLLFLAASYIVTMWRYSAKDRKGLSQGQLGERGVRNVLSNGAIPFVIVLTSGLLDEISAGLAGFLFIISIAIATSDTFASEIGIVARKPRMITSPKTIVKPGVDGGVSLLGNTAAFLGALIIGIGGYFLVTDRLTTIGPHGLEAGVLVVMVAVVVGWFGCQFDSLLGATLQRKGLVSNDMVNFLTILVGMVFSLPLYFLLY